MKQFIVLAAVMPILMIFVTQAVCDQKSSHSINIARDMVYVAKEEAKEAGEFTPEIMEKLREDLSGALKVPPGEISFASRLEGDIIYYRVEIPIKDVAAGNKLLGIKDKDNQYMYVIDSYTKVREV